MQAVFIELPAFERHRAKYLDDEGFAQLQMALMADLAARQRAALKQLVKTDLIMRRKP